MLYPHLLALGQYRVLALAVRAGLAVLHRGVSPAAGIAAGHGLNRLSHQDRLLHDFRLFDRPFPAVFQIDHAADLAQLQGHALNFFERFFLGQLFETLYHMKDNPQLVHSLFVFRVPVGIQQDFNLPLYDIGQDCLKLVLALNHAAGIGVLPVQAEILNLKFLHFFALKHLKNLHFFALKHLKFLHFLLKSNYECILA